MFRFVKIYMAFLKQEIKSLIEYKFDFMMGMIALGIEQVSAFLLLFAVFTQIKSIGSYSFEEILLFFGYSQILRGIDHILNDNIWMVGWNKVRDGSFSTYLIRPIKPLLHVIIERIQFDGIGEFLVGVLVYFYAINRLGITFSGKDYLVFLIFATTGLLIYFAVKLFFASIAFWIVSSGELMSLTYDVNSFTRYPMDIYNSKILKFILIYLLPFGVVSYFPMVYFIRL